MTTRAKKAELDQPRDEAASQASHMEEEMVPIHPQQNKLPPVWLGDFITGGELKQSLLFHPEASTQAAQIVKMAQQQLEYPPALEIKDMWHLSDDEEQRERQLPGEGLGTS